MSVKPGFEPGPDRGKTIEKYGAIKYLVGDAGLWKPITTSKTYQTPLIPQSLELIASAADVHPDNGVGVGAHAVEVTGLLTSSDLLPTKKEYKLDGISPVALAEDWWRVYRMKVIQCGTYATSVAVSHNSTITLQAAGGGDIWIQITPENGMGLAQTEAAVTTIPKGQHAHLEQYVIEVSNTNKAGTVLLLVREHADDIVTPFSGVMQSKKLHRNLGANVSVERKAKEGSYLLHIDGPADIGFMCYGAAAMELSVDFKLRCFNK